jgi:lysophospholipase L1-like esterase
MNQALANISKDPWFHCRQKSGILLFLKIILPLCLLLSLVAEIYASDHSDEAQSAQSFGDDAYHAQKYDIAITHYNRALALFSQQKEWDRAAVVRHYLGYCFLGSGKLESARKQFAANKTYHLEQENYSFAAPNFQYLIEILLKLKKPDDALDIAESYAPEKDNNKKRIARIFQLRILTLEQLGDVERMRIALKEAKQYLDAKDYEEHISGIEFRYKEKIEPNYNSEEYLYGTAITLLIFAILAYLFLHKSTSPISRGLKRVLANTTLVLASIIFVVGVSEIALRFMGLDGEIYRKSMVFDDNYDRIFVGSWYHDARFDDSAQYEHMRGQNVAYKKDPDDTRILFIGDSGTQGHGLALNTTFPARFEALVHEQNDASVSAINAGISGTDQVTQLNLLRDKFYKLTPDIVVLQIFMANDITDNFLRVNGVREGLSYKVINKLRSYSAFLNFLFLRWQILNSKYHILTPSTNGEGTVNFTIAPIDEDGINLMNQYWGEIATYKKQHSHTIKLAFSAFEDLLKEFKILSYKHGFQLVLTMIPTLSQVQGDFEIMKRPNSLQQLKDSGVDIDVQDLDTNIAIQKILAICARQEIPCYDPSNKLRNYGKQAFLPDDDHLSQLGHKVLAKVLYKNYDANKQKFR